MRPYVASRSETRLDRAVEEDPVEETADVGRGEHNAVIELGEALVRHLIGQLTASQREEAG